MIFQKLLFFSESLFFSPSTNFSISKLLFQSCDFTISNVFFSLTGLFSPSYFFSESKTLVPQIISNPKKKSPIITIGIPIIIVALLILAILLVLFIIFWKRKKEEETDENERKNVETDLINEQKSNNENELYRPISDSNDKDLNFWL